MKMPSVIKSSKLRMITWESNLVPFWSKAEDVLGTTQPIFGRQEHVAIHTLDSSSEDEYSLRMTRPEPRIQANSNGFKVEIPEFEGKLDPKEFLDWMHTVER